MNDPLVHDQPEAYREIASLQTDELKWLYYELYKGVPCLESCFSTLMRGIRHFSDSEKSHALIDRPETSYPGFSGTGSSPLGMVLHADTFADSPEDLENRIPYFLEAGISFLHLCSLPGAESEAALTRFFKSCHEAGITICVSVPALFHSPAALNRTISDMLFYVGLGADMMFPEVLPGQRLKPSVLRILRIVCDLVCPAFRLAGEKTCSGIDMRYECSLLYSTALMSSIWNSVATEDTGLLRHTLELAGNEGAASRSLNYLRRQDLLNWDLDFEFLENSGMDARVHRHFLNDFFTGIFPDSFSRGSLYHPGSVSTSSGLCGTTASFCGIEKYGFEGNRTGVSISVDLILMLHAFIFSLPGFPVICSGDEIGMVNDYSYRRNKVLLPDDRHLHHSSFRWDLAERRFLEGTVQNRLFTVIAKLNRIRSEHAGLFFSSSLRPMDTWSRSVTGIVRETTEEKFIGLYNFHRRQDMAWINEEDGLYQDLLTGNKMEARGISLEPFSFLWLLKKK